MTPWLQFGLLLLREPTLATRGSIIWGHQSLLAVMTIHALWHYNEVYSENPVSVRWDASSHKLRAEMAKRLPNDDHRRLHIPPYHPAQAAQSFDDEHDGRSGGALVTVTKIDNDAEEGKYEEETTGEGRSGLENRPQVSQHYHLDLPRVYPRPAAATAAVEYLGNEREKVLSSWPQPLSSRRGQGAGTPPVVADVPLGTVVDLQDMPPEDVMRAHRRVFEDMPLEGFDGRFRNPCWPSSAPRVGGGRNLLVAEDIAEDAPHEEVAWNRTRRSFLAVDRGREGGGGRLRGRRRPDPPGMGKIECLPYAYLLGLPKCGSSDLWERLAMHPLIEEADRKEVQLASSLCVRVWDPVTRWD